jgi:hypothetical protein
VMFINGIWYWLRLRLRIGRARGEPGMLYQLSYCPIWWSRL